MMGGALASSRAGHPTQKCCSSSTCPVLHDCISSFPLEGRCIYQFQFVVVLFLLSIYQRPVRFHSNFLYIATPVFKLMYNLCQLWFEWNFSLPPLLFSMKEIAGDYMLELFENPSQEVQYHQDCRPHPAKVCLLHLTSCLDFLLLQASCILCISFCFYKLVQLDTVWAVIYKLCMVVS